MTLWALLVRQQIPLFVRVKARVGSCGARCCLDAATPSFTTAQHCPRGVWRGHGPAQGQLPRDALIWLPATESTASCVPLPAMSSSSSRSTCMYSS
jgi:hypothetical protein